MSRSAWNPFRDWPAAVLLICAWTGGPDVGLAAEASSEIPALRAALEAGDFKTLENKFVGYQRAFEQGDASEWVVDDNFETFYTSDPDFEAPLDRWTEQYPDSFAAPMARAVYQSYRASLASEFLHANDIPDERIRDIEAWEAAAARDYATALARNRKLSVAYAGLIGLARRAHDAATVDRLLEQGLAAVPDSAVIYGSYIVSLHPSWALHPGTWKQRMRKHIEYARSVGQKYVDNPDFAWLGGYDHYLVGRDLASDCQIDAIEEFTQAIKIQENWYYYQSRGIAYDCQLNDPRAPAGFMRKALMDYERAFALNPHDVDVLLRLASMESRLCKSKAQFTAEARDYCAAAFEHLKQAVERDPLHPEAALALSGALSKRQQPAEAARLLEDALVYGAHDVNILRARAWILALRNAPGAAEGFLAAVRRAPSERDLIDGFRDYVTFLESGGKCRSLLTLAELEQMCRKNERCRTEIGVKLDTFQMQSGHSCGAESGPVAAKPLPMPDDVIPQ